MQRTPDGRQSPHDVPGYNRAVGIDDPVPDREYGDQQNGPPADVPRTPEEARENDSTREVEDQ